MSQGAGFSADLDELGSAAGGIIGVLAELDARRVNDIDCDSVSFGHDRLAGTTKDFRDCWCKGVQNLAQDGRQIADRLVRTGNTYGQADASARDALTIAASGGEAGDAAL